MTITFTHPEQNWQAVLSALEQHQSVGFPTETVWGIGADAYSKQAIRALNDLKGRHSDKALQVSCLDIEQALRLAKSNQVNLKKLLCLLPGPLTLVVWAAPDCPLWLQKGGKVGLRVPNHPTIQELLRRFGGPLATTSLNPTGLPPAQNWQEAQAYGLAAALLDGPSDPKALPSTVVDCTTGQILREGALSGQVRAILREGDQP